MHLLPSDIPAAGFQRDGKEEKAACSPLCHVPTVNIQQDRTHGFASLFFPLTLHPAAVQRTGNASWLLTSVSLTFYPMVDSAAEVSGYPPVGPLTIVLPAGSQRSGRGRNKLSPTRHYRSTRWKKEAVTLLLVNSLSSTIVPPAGMRRQVILQALVCLSSTIVPPVVVNEAEENETSSRLSPTIVPPAGSQRSGRGEHASHPPHEVHRLSPPNPVCPTRGSRHRPA